jgi:hypothetical protein
LQSFKLFAATAGMECWYMIFIISKPDILTVAVETKEPKVQTH